MNQRLEESAEIIERAMVEFKPYATVLMLSGGDDSLLTMKVLEELGVKPCFIMHGVTGTGIQEAKDFVYKTVANSGIRFLEANAGNAYERYVMRKGFFGKGISSHAISYHLLKSDHFTRTVSKNIRHKAKNRNVLYFCGIRVDESENRRKNFGATTIQRAKPNSPNIWVHVVHWWTTRERRVFGWKQY